MSFMQPQIQLGQWYEIDGPVGTEFVSAELVGKDIEFDSDDRLGAVPHELQDYCENTKAATINLIDGYGIRLSAPGYMDRTDWTVFNTEAEARNHLAEMYDLCEYCLSELDQDYKCSVCNE